jgi:hypothetical protein
MPVAARGNAPQRSQRQDDQGRAHVLAPADQALAVHQQSQQEAHVARDNATLNTLVGART